MRDTQIQNINIHKVERGDIERLRDLSAQMRLSKDIDYFERNFDYQEAGEREVLVVAVEGEDAGYCILNWKPKYALFKKLEVPEIQDLNVLPKFRQRGIGTAMIEHCEEEAIRRGCEMMGLGVGVDVSYGPAQRLYTKLGYIPDGNGVTYDRKLVAAGEFKPIDDNLCLMMVKGI